MKIQIRYMSAALIILIFAFQALAQNAQWVKFRTHNILFNPDFASFPICSDNSGNVFMSSIEVYKTSWSLDFLGDMRIEKYDPNGNVLLTKVLIGKLAVKQLATDYKGNLYLRGSFLDSIIVDSSVIVHNTGSGFSLNSFIMKFDGNGNFVWSKNINALYDEFSQVDHIYVSGNRLFAGILDFDDGEIKIYDLDGNEISAIQQNPVRGISSIITDSKGSIIAAGSCGHGAINFGDTSVNTQFTYNAYYVKYNSSGDLQWVRFVEDITFSEVNLAADGNDNIYASGDLFNSVWFGNIRAEGRQWVYDFYLTKIDPSGNFQWVREVPHQSTITGDARKARLNSIAVNHVNEILFAGMLRGLVNWGNDIVTTAAGGNDAVLLKYDSDGNIMSGKRFGGGSSDRGDHILFDNNGNAYLSGNFGVSATFDTITVSGSGQINSYLVKLPFSQSSGTINLSMIMEGFYNSSSDEMRIRDTVALSLCAITPPYQVIEEQISVIEKSSFTGVFRFNSAPSANYYLRVRHRNSVETWSANPVPYERGGITSFSFIGSPSQAFGGNQLQIDHSPVRFAVYSGDVDQDGSVDALDASMIDNDAFIIRTGYINTDATGDGIVDASDASIADNNTFNFISKITP